MHHHQCTTTDASPPMHHRCILGRARASACSRPRPQRASLGSPSRCAAIDPVEVCTAPPHRPLLAAEHPRPLASSPLGRRLAVASATPPPPPSISTSAITTPSCCNRPCRPYPARSALRDVRRAVGISRSCASGPLAADGDARDPPRQRRHTSVRPCAVTLHEWT